MKKYVGFNVLDMKSGNEYKFIYVKGIDSDECELRAINQLMRKLDLPRSNFMVSGLIKK